MMATHADRCRLRFKNLSGPLTIADYTGKSASIGLVQYVSGFPGADQRESWRL